VGKLGGSQTTNIRNKPEMTGVTGFGGGTQRRRVGNKV